MIRFLLAATLFGFGVAPIRADEPTFSSALQKQAGPMIEQLKKRGCTNVGVLKFLVRQGKDSALQDDAGDINHSLANQTQRALILANTEPEFGIIESPSAFVVKSAMTDANHRTDEGRKAFFAKKFELAWSRDKVEPSSFLIGTATIDGGLKTMVVQFQMFKSDGKIEGLGTAMTVTPGPELLAQAGHSYTMPATRRKALVSGEKLAPEVQKEIVEEMKQSAPVDTTPEKLKPFAPLADCPIKWVIQYNGKDVDVTGNSIPTPKPKDKVTFILSNPTKEIYGVVLLVNGESTLYQEKSSPLSCRKWILEPNSETTIFGFQTSAKEALPFEVVAPEDARADSVRYGDHAGTFRMVVFLGTTTADGTKINKPEQKDDAQIVAMVHRGSEAPKGTRPQTLRGLQAQLREANKDAKDGGRGFVVKGDVAELSDTQQAFFQPTSDTPVSDISLRYFAKPKN